MKLFSNFSGKGDVKKLATYSKWNEDMNSFIIWEKGIAAPDYTEGFSKESSLRFQSSNPTGWQTFLSPTFPQKMTEDGAACA